MSYTARTDYRCSVNTDKEYTTFRWSLPDFSLLREYYQNFVSSEFMITNTDTKCKLQLVLTEPQFFTANNCLVCVTVSFLYNTILHNRIMVIVSFINKDGRKVLSLSQRRLSSQADMAFEMMHASTLIPYKLSDYTENNTLTILCEIINIPSLESTLTDTKKHVKHFSEVNEVQKKLSIYFDAKSFCDVVFTVGSTEFHGHRVIIAANSPVFETMFSTDMSEAAIKTVNISDIDAATFESFLKFMYTSSVEKMEEIAGDLLIVADKYQVLSLRNLCETYIAKHLDKANAIQYLLLADMHNLETLKTKALIFLRSCQQDIVDMAEFKKLCPYPDFVSEIFRK